VLVVGTTAVVAGVPGAAGLFVGAGGFAAGNGFGTGVWVGGGGCVGGGVDCANPGATSRLANTPAITPARHPNQG